MNWLWFCRSITWFGRSKSHAYHVQFKNDYRSTIVHFTCAWFVGESCATNTSSLCFFVVIFETTKFEKNKNEEKREKSERKKNYLSQICVCLCVLETHSIKTHYILYIALRLFACHCYRSHTIVQSARCISSFECRLKWCEYGLYFSLSFVPFHLPLPYGCSTARLLFHRFLFASSTFCVVVIFVFGCWSFYPVSWFSLNSASR